MRWEDYEFIRDVPQEKSSIAVRALTGWEGIVFELEDDAGSGYFFESDS